MKQIFFNFFILAINNFTFFYKEFDPLSKPACHVTSNDIFDFDAYLSHYKGSSYGFMEKLVRTQAFNNFIEETYDNDTHKSAIGFFKTNINVLVKHSFKTLKQQQRKLINEIYGNFLKPVKFNFSHIYDVYRKELLQRHAKPI